MQCDTEQEDGDKAPRTGPALGWGSTELAIEISGNALTS